jgi:putative heme-binding domain-containing protein
MSLGEDQLRAALRDSSAEVRLFAVRCIAERRISAMRDDLAAVLKSQPLSISLFRAVVGAIAWLDQGTIPAERNYHERLLLDVLSDESLPAAVRAMALGLLPPDHEELPADRLREMLLLVGDQALLTEIVRTLALRQNEDALPILAELALDKSLPESLRAEAVMGLGASARRYERLLLDLTNDASPKVREEAARGLRGLPSVPASVQDFEEIAPTDFDAWWQLVGIGGDAEAGRRVFFGAKAGHCSRCHVHGGRGALVGPDLTDTGRHTDRRRLMESILQPQREVAPRFSPWSIMTVDGKVHTGLAAPQPYSDSRGQQVETFVDNNGRIFVLKTTDIESRKQLPTSIMPSGLERTIQAKELRDLLAFLTSAVQP